MGIGLRPLYPHLSSCLCVYVFNVHYVIYVYFCVSLFLFHVLSKLCNLGAALRALTEPCMSCLPIVHCHFTLHFYERINDDDEMMMILRYSA